MSKITAYSALTGPAGPDVVPIVDTSDTTMAASGTTKKIALSDLLTTAQGMVFMTGNGTPGTTGGTITATTINNAITAGAQGIFLDPRYVWDMSGLTINGISNFTIASAMMGSIGWTGGITYNTTGYIKTDSVVAADGIKVFSSAPGTARTQGIVFRGCVFVGSHSNAVIHFGGGQRRCGVVDCLIYNTSAAPGSYGMQIDTALSDNNSENGIFDWGGGGGVAGGYGALGLGLGDQTQHCNDTLFHSLTTSAGTYSINAATSSNNTFTNWYDRSSPATANILNAGVLTFIGGEDLNNSGLSYSTSGTTTIWNRLLTNGNITCNGGNVVFRGRCRCLVTINISAGGVADLSDPACSFGSTTVAGSSGTLFKSAFYGPGGTPGVAGWTGTTHTSSWT